MSSSEIGLWLGFVAMSCAAGVAMCGGVALRGAKRHHALCIAAILSFLILAGVAFVSSADSDVLRYALVVTWMGYAFADIPIFAGIMDKSRASMPGFDVSIQIAILFQLQTLAEPFVGLTIDATRPEVVLYGAAFVGLLTMMLTLYLTRPSGET